MILRPYQSLAVSMLRDNLARRPILRMDTGSGKTAVAAEIARLVHARGKRTLFLCDRREIVLKTVSDFRALGIPTGAILAGQPAETHPHQVAAAQTLARRALPEADLLIVDECRLSLALTQRRIVEHYPTRIGLDATPCREDGNGLGSLYGCILEPTTTAALVAGGHLARYRYFAPTIPDLRGVKRVAGDYEKAQAGERMSTRHIVGRVTEALRQHPGVYLAFACTVKHSLHMRDELRAAGFKAEHADGKTPKNERDRVLGMLKRREIDVLTNCNLVGYGFDAPAIDGVLLLRPTRSIAVHRQQIGRGLRPPGPATILDFAGNVHALGLPDDPVEWSLDDHVTAPRPSPLSTCMACYAIFASGPTVCPACGAEKHVQRVTVVSHDAPLREVTVSPPKPPPIPRFIELLTQAHANNAKPGWAQFAFKRERGFFPKGDIKGAVERERASCQNGSGCRFCVRETA